MFWYYRTYHPGKPIPDYMGSESIDKNDFVSMSSDMASKDQAQILLFD